MGSLANERHEEFARLVNAGMKPAKAYLAVGYKSDPAGASSSRLAKKVRIATRIAELSDISAKSSAFRAQMDRDWVLTGLRGIAENTKLAASARVSAYIACGKELGLFRDQTDHTIKWDGDLRSLNQAQLTKLMGLLEQIAFGGDPALIAAAREEACKSVQ